MLSKFVEPPQRRFGFTIPEIVISLGLMGVVLTVIVPLARRAGEQGRRSETRRAALLEVSNALETLTADPQAAPAAGEERVLPVPPQLASRLNEVELRVKAVGISDPTGRRFDVALTWLERNGRRSSPIRLSAFSFEMPGKQEATP